MLNVFVYNIDDYSRRLRSLRRFNIINDDRPRIFTETGTHQKSQNVE